MDLEDELRLLGMLAGACLLLFPAALQAQTVWDMPTEYPENAMPGVGLAAFTKHVARSSAGKLEIRPSFDAKAGIKSAGMLAAIAEGRVQAGDAFAGALEAEDPIFALPSLPFLVTSTADAKTPCRHRAAASCGGAAEERPAAALSDALAAFRHLVEDAADVTARPRRTFHSHL